MPPSSLAAAAALVAVLSWFVLRRRPVVLLRSTDASAVAALNRSTLERVLPDADDLSGSGGKDRQASPEAGASALQDGLHDVPAAGPQGHGARPRRAWLRSLERALGSEQPAVRVAAMRAARLHGDRTVLPLLLRGRRDPHLAVALEAARGLERFRGRPAGDAQPPAATPPPPRNVSRTR